MRFILIALGALSLCAGCMENAVARAGEDQTAQPGATVTLDGSASTPDARGRLNYLWEVVDGPEVAFADSAAEVTTFTAPRRREPADVVIRLTVTYVDLSGKPTLSNQDSDDLTVHVSADPDAPPTTQPADGSESTDAGTDGAATDGFATDGASTDGFSTDGAGTDGAGSDGASTDGRLSDGASTAGFSTTRFAVVRMG